MKVSTIKATRLICTYWGSDKGRKFDIYANDQKIGEQILENNKPSEFFDEVYIIPLDLVKDKTDAFGQKIETVTIKFKARAENVAGGLYGIKTVEMKN